MPVTYHAATYQHEGLTRDGSPALAHLIGLSVAALAVAFASAAYIVYDIGHGERQMMTVMKWVWPLTALYMGPLAIWAYRALGLSGMRHQQGGQDDGSTEPFWHDVFKGVTHCGGGLHPRRPHRRVGRLPPERHQAGIALWPAYSADYLLGIVFQYFSIAPMRGLGLKDGVIAAIKADTLSLTAFEVGLFGWMALTSFVLFNHQLHSDSPVYWFMMQIGMVVGFATSSPMNWWLIKRGLKERM